MVWDYERLWQKTKLYAARAMQEDRENDLFPLWAAFTLELLARATLAFVHPALLADPQSGGHLMYSFGFGTVKVPKSTPAKTVFERCRVVVENFTEDDEKVSLTIIERRNAELHSGEDAFATFKTAHWLADFYRVCELLLTSQRKSLDELFGVDEASAARKMIAASRTAIRQSVEKRIAEAKRIFDALSGDQRATAVAGAKDAVATVKRIPCPACSTPAAVTGEEVSAMEPYLTPEGGVQREVVGLPVRLSCFACGLTLTGHEELHAVALGGQYTTTEQLDPLEYYGAYEDWDYGND